MLPEANIVIYKPGIYGIHKPHLSPVGIELCSWASIFSLIVLLFTTKFSQYTVKENKGSYWLAKITPQSVEQQLNKSASYGF